MYGEPELQIQWAYEDCETVKGILSHASIYRIICQNTESKSASFMTEHIEIYCWIIFYKVFLRGGKYRWMSMIAMKILINNCYCHREIRDYNTVNIFQAMVAVADSGAGGSIQNYAAYFKWQSHISRCARSCFSAFVKDAVVVCELNRYHSHDSVASRQSVTHILDRERKQCFSHIFYYLILETFQA